MSETGLATEENNTKVKSDQDVIQTLRTVHQNQAGLLVMADQKANILIGVVAVMLTFILTNSEFLSSIEPRYLPIFSAFVMLEILSLLMSLFVVIPKNSGKIKGISEGDDMPNPLYFGHFTHLSENTFYQYMSSKLVNDKVARDLLIRDIYNIGLVLKSKYRRLKIAYSLAMVGIITLAVYAALHVVDTL